MSRLWLGLLVKQQGYTFSIRCRVRVGIDHSRVCAHVRDFQSRVWGFFFVCVFNDFILSNILWKVCQLNIWYWQTDSSHALSKCVKLSPVIMTILYFHVTCSGQRKRPISMISGSSRSNVSAVKSYTLQQSGLQTRCNFCRTKTMLFWGECRQTSYKCSCVFLSSNRRLGLVFS